ncbi:MAG TPA: hypothetical protein VIL65_10055 [Beijerinckiaceae bacterium]
MLAILIVALASPALAGEADRTASAWKALREHELLSMKQLGCAYLMERDDSTARRVKVGVYETHDARCGGDPDVTHRLFDLELDRRKGRVLWDNNPDQEMRPVPPRRR